MCERGDTVDLVVPVPGWMSSTGAEDVEWLIRPIDRCLVEVVSALNAAGALTANCCCGHDDGIQTPMIWFHDRSRLELQNGVWVNVGLDREMR